LCEARLQEAVRNGNGRLSSLRRSDHNLVSALFVNLPAKAYIEPELIQTPIPGQQLIDVVWWRLAVYHPFETKTLI